MDYWRLIYQFAITVLIGLLAIGAYLALSSPSQTLRENHRRRIQLMEESAQLTEQIQDLAEKQVRFRSDPVFVERTAREAGMVKTNEVIFKLEGAEEARQR